jgi:hypothetical protein
VSNFKYHHCIYLEELSKFTKLSHDSQPVVHESNPGTCKGILTTQHKFSIRTGRQPIGYYKSKRTPNKKRRRKDPNFKSQDTGQYCHKLYI